MRVMRGRVSVVVRALEPRTRNHTRSNAFESAEYLIAQPPFADPEGYHGCRQRLLKSQPRTPVTEIFDIVSMRAVNLCQLSCRRGGNTARRSRGRSEPAPCVRPCERDLRSNRPLNLDFMNVGPDGGPVLHVRDHRPNLVWRSGNDDLADCAHRGILIYQTVLCVPLVQLPPGGPDIAKLAQQLDLGLAPFPRPIIGGSRPRCSMYRRTVLRSSLARRAIAEMLIPCRKRKAASYSAQLVTRCRCRGM
jgi:hypothetical protein